MTLHFHSKHFKNTKLTLTEYLILLVYEDGQQHSLHELKEVFDISERTVIRARNVLVEKGYMTSPKERVYYVTDKLYPPFLKTIKIPVAV